MFVQDHHSLEELQRLTKALRLETGRQRGFFVHLLDRPGVRSCLSAGGAPSATGEFGAPVPDHLPFGSSLTAS